MNESTDPQRRAVAARLMREQRIQTLRMRVLAFAVALFLAAWVGLYLQLVGGHDPALAKAATPVATQSADPQVAGDGWTSQDRAGSADSSAASSDATDAGPPDSAATDGSSAGTSSSSTSTQDGSGTAPVTTRQS